MSFNTLASDVLADDGTVSAPSIAFYNWQGSGFYIEGNGGVSCAINGTKTFGVSSSGLVLKGTTTNDAAAAGFIGEEIIQTRLKSAATALSTGTTANVTATALTLTAGDWDISGVVGFVPAGTTSVTYLVGAICTTSATLGGTDTIGVPDAAGQIRIQLATAANVMGGDITLTIPPVRVSIAASTTYYLCAQATFTVSTCTGFGYIRARRIR